MCRLEQNVSIDVKKKKKNYVKSKVLYILQMLYCKSNIIY